jgi:hypothetical protein
VRDGCSTKCSFATIATDDITDDPNCPARVWDTTGTVGAMTVTVTNDDGSMGNPNVYYDPGSGLLFLAGAASDIYGASQTLTEANIAFFNLVVASH